MENGWWERRAAPIDKFVFPVGDSLEAPLPDTRQQVKKFGINA
jgi:hypothetical protein